MARPRQNQRASGEFFVERVTVAVATVVQQLVAMVRRDDHEKICRQSFRAQRTEQLPYLCVGVRDSRVVHSCHMLQNLRSRFQPEIHP